MIFSRTGGNLRKTGLVLITAMLLTASIVCGADSLPKSSATQWEAKAEPIEWKKITEAAKKEGMVSAYSAGWGPATRTALTEAFKAKYGISLEFTAFGRGAEMSARVEREKAAGLNLADFFPTGSGTLITIMKPIGLLGNIEPLLVLPEVTDLKVWGGKLPFIDKAKTAFAMTASLQRYILYNTDLIKKGEITSFKDLLKPQYKGKITMNDPTMTGPGNSLMTFLAQDAWNLQEAKDFLTRLIKQQEVEIQRDSRLHVESVARGKFAIGLGPWPDVLTGFLKAGAHLDVVILQEGTNVSPAAGAFGIPTVMAHPNAAKLFINWLLTKEGQTVLAQSYGNPSMRLDVPTEGINPAFLRRPGEKLIMETDESISFKGQMLAITKQVIQEAAK